MGKKQHISTNVANIKSFCTLIKQMQNQAMSKGNKETVCKRVGWNDSECAFENHIRTDLQILRVLFVWGGKFQIVKAEGI